jgi:hypothetical protein
VNLNEDDKDQLKELMLSESWKSVKKLCEVLVDKQASVVLTCSVEELTSARARYDGALLLYAGLDAAKRQLTKEK